MEIQWQKYIDLEQLEILYQSVGWCAYTNNLPLLQQAIRQSLEVVTMWEQGRLIGLVRAVGDGLTILYIQDVLVLPAYQNQGVASELMEQLLTKYEKVRQKVLLTEDETKTRHFYEKNGFISCDKGNAVAFAKLG